MTVTGCIYIRAAVIKQNQSLDVAATTPSRGNIDYYLRREKNEPTCRLGRSEASSLILEQIEEPAQNPNGEGSLLHCQW